MEDGRRMSHIGILEAMPRFFQRMQDDGFYVKGNKSMKTICFLTRCHPARPNMQKICLDSVKAQTCDDYQHFLIQGAMREEEDGSLSMEAGLKKRWPIDARYVMVLDDDNVLVCQDFVKEFKELTQKENPDIVIFRGEIGGYGPCPPGVLWGRPPVHCGIDWFCYAVKREMWDKHSQVIGSDPTIHNDFLFIHTCFNDTKSVVWFDRIIAKTQRMPMKGRGENEI